jgi:Mg2+/Co2+ transporter CorC
MRRLFRVQPRTRGELIDILRDAERNNVLDADLLTMLEGAMQVSEMQVRDIMVPRSQMIVVEEGVEPRDFLPTVIDSGHSRFPVVNDRKDQVVGILLAKDLLAYLAQANGERCANSEPVAIILRLWWTNTAASLAWSASRMSSSRSSERSTTNTTSIMKTTSNRMVLRASR